MTDDSFSDEAYHRLQAGGMLQRDRVLQTWRANNPRHTPLAPEPSVLDLISESPQRRTKHGGFAETAVGPDRAALRPTEPQEPLSIHDQGTLPPEKASPQIERERLCSCGCGERVKRSNQKYVNTKHRQRDWIRQKRRKKGPHA